METKVMILLNEMTKAQKFINEVSKFNSDIDISRGRYLCDAKSLMGVFSFDLSIPVQVEIHSDDTEEIKQFNDLIKDFVC